MSKYYGGLIAATVPFNVLTFFLAPVYMVTSNKQFLTSLTKCIKVFNYAFILMPLAVVFACVNLICLTFAYLRTILIKIGLVRKGATPCTELLTFMLIGIPLLLAYQVYDLVDFIKWSSHMEDPNEKADKFHIKKAHFMLFYKLLQGMDQMKEPISARALI